MTINQANAIYDIIVANLSLLKPINKWYTFWQNQLFHLKRQILHICDLTFDDLERKLCILRLIRLSFRKPYLNFDTVIYSNRKYTWIENT